MKTLKLKQPKPQFYCNLNMWLDKKCSSKPCSLHSICHLPSANFRFRIIADEPAFWRRLMCWQRLEPWVQLRMQKKTHKRCPECVMIERCMRDLCHNGFNRILCGNPPGNKVIHMPLIFLASHSTGELCDAYQKHVYFVCKFLRDQQLYLINISHGNHSI